MMTTTKGQIRTLVTALDTLEIPTPNTVQTALAEREKIQAAAEAWNIDYASLVDAWATATLSGKDPRKDPQVVAFAVQNAIAAGPFINQANEAAEGRIVNAIKSELDSILAALKEKVDNAGQAATEANQILNGVPLDEVKTIFAMGGDAVAAHTRASAAVKTIDVGHNAWRNLASLTRFANPETRRIDVLTDAHLDAYERHSVHGRTWQLIAEGLTIDLATDRATVEARTKRHQDDRQAAIDAERRAFSDALKNRAPLVATY